MGKGPWEVLCGRSEACGWPLSAPVNKRLIDENSKETETAAHLSISIQTLKTKKSTNTLLLTFFWTSNTSFSDDIWTLKNIASGLRYLFLALILGYQVERDGVERAGHDAEHAAEDERGDDVGEESDQAGAHAEHKVAHEV